MSELPIHLVKALAANDPEVTEVAKWVSKLYDRLKQGYTDKEAEEKKRAVIVYQLAEMEVVKILKDKGF